MTILTCTRCSHQWATRQGRKTARICPHCKSVRWDDPAAGSHPPAPITSRPTAPARTPQPDAPAFDPSFDFGA